MSSASGDQGSKRPRGEDPDDDVVEDHDVAVKKSKVASEATPNGEGNAAVVEQTQQAAADDGENAEDASAAQEEDKKDKPHPAEERKETSVIELSDSEDEGDNDNADHLESATSTTVGPTEGGVDAMAVDEQSQHQQPDVAPSTGSDREIVAQGHPDPSISGEGHHHPPVPGDAQHYPPHHGPPYRMSVRERRERIGRAVDTLLAEVHETQASQEVEIVELQGQVRHLQGRLNSLQRQYNDDTARLSAELNASKKNALTLSRMLAAGGPSNGQGEGEAAAHPGGRSFPHSRPDCLVQTTFHRNKFFPAKGADVANLEACDQCYCYACGMPAAACVSWAASPYAHCNAWAGDLVWRAIRVQLQKPVGAVVALLRERGVSAWDVEGPVWTMELLVVASEHRAAVRYEERAMPLDAPEWRDPRVMFGRVVELFNVKLREMEEAAGEDSVKIAEGLARLCDIYIDLLDWWQSPDKVPLAQTLAQHWMALLLARPARLDDDLKAACIAAMKDWCQKDDAMNGAFVGIVAAAEVGWDTEKILVADEREGVVQHRIKVLQAGTAPEDVQLLLDYAVAKGQLSVAAKLMFDRGSEDEALAYMLRAVPLQVGPGPCAHQALLDKIDGMAGTLGAHANLRLRCASLLARPCQAQDIERALAWSRDRLPEIARGSLSTGVVESLNKARAWVRERVQVNNGAQGGSSASTARSHIGAELAKVLTGEDYKGLEDTSMVDLVLLDLVCGAVVADGACDPAGVLQAYQLVAEPVAYDLFGLTTMLSVPGAAHALAGPIMLAADESFTDILGRMDDEVAYDLLVADPGKAKEAAAKWLKARGDTMWSLLSRAWHANPEGFSVAPYYRPKVCELTKEAEDLASECLPVFFSATLGRNDPIVGGYMHSLVSVLCKRDSGVADRVVGGFLEKSLTAENQKSVHGRFFPLLRAYSTVNKEKTVELVGKIYEFVKDGNRGALELLKTNIDWIAPIVESQGNEQLVRAMQGLRFDVSRPDIEALKAYKEVMFSSPLWESKIENDIRNRLSRRLDDAHKAREDVAQICACLAFLGSVEKSMVMLERSDRHLTPEQIVAAYVEMVPYVNEKGVAVIIPNLCKAVQRYVAAVPNLLWHAARVEQREKKKGGKGGKDKDKNKDRDRDRDSGLDGGAAVMPALLGKAGALLADDLPPIAIDSIRKGVDMFLASDPPPRVAENFIAMLVEFKRAVTASGNSAVWGKAIVPALEALKNKTHVWSLYKHCAELHEGVDTTATTTTTTATNTSSTSGDRGHRGSSGSNAGLTAGKDASGGSQRRQRQQQQGGGGGKPAHQSKPKQRPSGHSQPGTGNHSQSAMSPPSVTHASRTSSTQAQQHRHSSSTSTSATGGTSGARGSSGIGVVGGGASRGTGIGVVGVSSGIGVVGGGAGIGVVGGSKGIGVVGVSSSTTGMAPNQATISLPFTPPAPATTMGATFDPSQRPAFLIASNPAEQQQQQQQQQQMTSYQQQQQQQPLFPTPPASSQLQQQQIPQQQQTQQYGQFAATQAPMYNMQQTQTQQPQQPQQQGFYQYPTGGYQPPQPSEPQPPPPPPPAMAQPPVPPTDQSFSGYQQPQQQQQQAWGQQYYGFSSGY